MARIVFLQRLYYEYGGPAIISAVLRGNGHDVSLLIGEKSHYFLSKVKKTDIVAFSTMTGMHHWAIKIASEIKKKMNILTVFGGPHPTYAPEIIEHPSVDVVCLGEGEYPMLDLADSFDTGKDISSIPNLWVKKNERIYKNEIRPLIEDLDSLPFSDRRLYYKTYYYLRKSPLKRFMAARGCPYRCSFCFNPRLQEMYRGRGRYVRFRSPHNIVEEIKKVKNGYGLRGVFFTDDVFTLNKNWLREFLPLYKKYISLPFTCDSRVDILDEEIAALLKDAGCLYLRIGIESGNEKIRNEILKKDITDDQIINAVQILKKYKIKFMTYNMVGIPEETLENAYQTVELNIKIKTNYPRCSILTPYPGTEIAAYAAQRGLLDATPDKIIASFQQYKSIIKSEYKNQILNLHSFFQTVVIFPWSWRIIKQMIKFPPNPLFRMWWAMVYFFVFIKVEGINLWYAFLFALRTLRAVFEEEKHG